MLMAGLDGVVNRLEPGEPLDKDIYDLSPEEMKSVPSMPGSLEEALTCLEEDHQFLLKGDVFTEELLETFIEYKRKNRRLKPFGCVRILTSFRCTTTSKTNSPPMNAAERG